MHGVRPPPSPNPWHAPGVKYRHGSRCMGQTNTKYNENRRLGARRVEKRAQATSKYHEIMRETWKSARKIHSFKRNDSVWIGRIAYSSREKLFKAWCLLATETPLFRETRFSSRVRSIMWGPKRSWPVTYVRRQIPIRVPNVESQQSTKSGKNS